MHSPIVFSPTSAIKYDSCARQWYFQKGLGIRSESVNAALPFGRSTHAVKTDIVIATAEGKVVPGTEAEDRFTELWSKAATEEAIEYTSTWDWDSLNRVGRNIISNFNVMWSQQGIVPVIDTNGDYVIERAFKMVISDEDAVLLRGIPDLVGMNAEGQVLVIDFKTTGSEAPEEFFRASTQLTDYQMLVEAHADELGIDGVDCLGFQESRKLKTKNGVAPPRLGPAHTGKRLAERRQELVWKAEDIRRGRFPMTSRAAFDTPCSMCDFRGLCLEGDTEGLIIPDESLAKLAA